MFITTKMAAPLVKKSKRIANDELRAAGMENIDSSTALVLHNNMSKPSLADSLKVGFFSQDRASQTESSEVVEVKELTQVVQSLLKDTANLKRDLMFTRQWMQTDFESKMQQKAIDLYCQINDKVKDLERTHEDRMDIVRRAFRQQLADALKIVNQSYNRSMQTKMKSAQRQQNSSSDKWQEKCRQLEDNIRAYDSTIRSLREQINNLQENPGNNDQIDVMEAELQDMKKEQRKLHKKLERLEEGLELKEQEVHIKDDEIVALSEKLTMNQSEMEKIQRENDDLKNAMLKERNAAKNELEKQRLEMERRMESQTKGATDEVLGAARREAQTLLETERLKYQELLEQKMLLEDLLAKEKAKVADLKNVKVVEPTKADPAEDSERSKRDVIKLRAELARLKREIDRINRAWEKKFAILQQSMHALKDESYLRTSLQRQSALLRQVTVTYSMDNPHYPQDMSPQGVMVPVQPPPPHSKSGRGRPLPNIATSPTKVSNERFVYTASAPSGRGTELFSVNENDIMSDNEDLPEGCVPLPPPPDRENSMSSKKGRAQSTKSEGHVVHVPSVAAQ